MRDKWSWLVILDGVVNAPRGNEKSWMIKTAHFIIYIAKTIEMCYKWHVWNFKVIPQRLKLPMNFFETFPEICSLPGTVSKTTIKMIGHHARLRDMTGQSYPIYGCIHANHARHSSVKVLIRGSLKHNLLKLYFGNNLTGRKCQVWGTISYEICWKITPFKMMRMFECSHIRCFRGNNLHSREHFLHISFFLSITVFQIFLKDNMYTVIKQ